MNKGLSEKFIQAWVSPSVYVRNNLIVDLLLHDAQNIFIYNWR